MTSAVGDADPVDMSAVVLHGRGDIRVERRPRPVAGPGELLLQVTTAGVCGTDVAEVNQGPALTPVHHRHPLTGHRGPLTLGHEFSGVVAAAGPGTRIPVGTHVTSGSGVSCGECRACQAGRTNLCSAYWTVGFHADGGLADYCVVPETVCVPYDSDVLTDDGAALAQPMAIAVHAARVADLQPDADVLVVGAGGIGAFLIAAVRYLCPTAHIVVVEPDADRRVVAVDMGSDAAIAPGDPIAGPVDAVFEVSGTEAGLDAALAAVTRGGTIVLVGIQHAGQAGVDVLRRATLDEIALVGSSAHVLRTDFPTALQVLASKPDWSSVAPTVGSLHACAVQLATPGAGHAIKALFSPRAEAARPAVYATSGGAA